MCGIIGGTRPTWKYQVAVDCIKHRGPDSQKIVVNPDLTLGFARLAIIDLSSAADQPMSDAKGQIWIVFNGEIYAYKNLRQDLISRGYFFKTHSDTEVIIQAYLEWGDDFVDHLDGMFAVAIHDLRTRELKLFRDRAGIKPLYYFYDGKEFAFASELKGIVRLCDDIHFEYDRNALFDYLTYSYIPEPKTVYRNVFKLLPAHQLVFNLRTKTISSVRPYWTLNPECTRPEITIKAAAATVRELIQESIRDQLVADVPVGCFLSGGMDSSIVAAEASLTKPDLEAFSIGFDDPRFTEVHYAQFLTAKFKLRHRIETLSSPAANDLFANLALWYDEPFADTSAFPTFLVSKFARQNATVVLTGDGGDEVFGGYSRFKIYDWVFKLPHLTHRGFNHRFGRWKYANCRTCAYRMFLAGEIFTSDEITCYPLLMGAMSPPEKMAYARQWDIPKDYDSYWYFRKYFRRDLPVLTRLQYLDFHTYLPSDILTKVDRVTMAVSLEARVPLLSRKIVEYVFSLPEHIRYFNGQLKGLLKETYRDILPKEIITRGKMGFSVPMQYFRSYPGRIQEVILKNIFKIT